jgi:hypothetical protein
MDKYKGEAEVTLRPQDTLTSLPSLPWERSTWATLAFALASGALAVKVLRNRRHLPRPPGPKGLEQDRQCCYRADAHPS